MRIRQANNSEYQAVRSFYHSLIDESVDLPYGAGWVKDAYPDPEYLQESIAAGQLYIGVQDQEIIAAMVVNHQGNESYNNFEWPTKAASHEVTVVHTLGVHPRHMGKGYGKQLVQFVIDKARQEKQKAIRLDVLKGNLPAEKLYESMGFVYLHTLPMFYEDTGWTDYELYEYAL